MKLSACSYLRCSGETQIQGGTWDRQQAAIDKYAAANGITVVKEFRDEGVTGKMELEGRDGLSSCIAYLRENKTDMVIVEDSSRLARDLIVAEVLIREFQKLGVKVVAASGGVNLTEGDDSNPTAKLIRQILAAVSEFDRCCINLKLKAGRQRVIDKFGKCEGRKSFGDKPGESAILARMRELREGGMIYAGIAAALTAEGHASRMGGDWTTGAVAKILSR